MFLHTAALLSAAVFVCGCRTDHSLHRAIDSADHAAWEQAAPGLLDRLRSSDVVVEVLAPSDEVGVMTAYATPRLPASRVRTDVHQHPIHAPPDGGTRSVRASIMASDAFDQLVIGWVEDRLDAYLVQVNGSCVLDWVDPKTGDRLEETSVLAWSANNGHGYESLGRMSIDAGLSTEEEMSLDRLRDLHERHPERIAELMLENPRYIFFRELQREESLSGSRGIPLVPGVSLATDPLHETGAILLIEPLDGSLPILGLAHDGGAAIVGPQRIDRYLGSGQEAMDLAGRVVVPARVRRVRLPDRP